MNTTNEPKKTNANKTNVAISLPRLVLLATTLVFNSQRASAQNPELLKRNVIARVDSIEPLIEEMAIKLWDYAELALAETRSADLLARKLDEAG
ncbi:MAG: hypothetical protein JSW47_21295, partial [Phycisphaerales bacterium]